MGGGLLRPEWKFFMACVSFLPEVTKTEVSLFQRKLEEAVKQDQKEKKANQELLKSLKMEKEGFLKEQQRYQRLTANQLESCRAFQPVLSLKSRHLVWRFVGVERPLLVPTKYCTFREEVEECETDSCLRE